MIWNKKQLYSYVLKSSICNVCNGDRGVKVYCTFFNMAFLLINQLKLLVVGFWISASCKARVHCVPQALVRSNLPRSLRHQTAFQMQTESDFATSYINISRLNGNILGMVPKSGHQAPKHIHFFYTVFIPSWFDPTKWRVYSAPDPVTLLLRCPYPLR